MACTCRAIFVGFLCLLLIPRCLSQECTLSGYLDKGIANSPLLKDISNQILSNQYDSLIARATALPQVDFNVSMMYAPTINGWGYSEVITNGQNLNGTVSVNQAIFNKKTREGNLEKYGLRTGSLSTTRLINANELKKAITAQYLVVYTAQEEHNYQGELLSTMKKEAVILKNWTEKGIYKQTDYLSFQVEMMSLQRNIRDLELSFRKELWNLDMICMIADTSVCTFTFPEIRDSLASSPEHSLYFRRFQLDSLMIVNDRFLLDRRYKPSVKWSADGGLVNNEPRYLYQNFGISAGLSLSLPVYDGNQRKISYGKIRIEEESRRLYQENFRFRYLSQLKQLHAELDEIRSLQKDNEKQVAMVEDLIQEDKTLFEAGSISITDYILALKNLVEAKHASLLYKIRGQYVLNEINFLKQ